MENKDLKVDFSNTKIAFSNKSDSELKEAIWLFGLMNKGWVVSLATWLSVYAVRWHLPFARKMVKATMFKQFVGGETLQECQPVIDQLWRSRVHTTLDYGAEGKTAEIDLDETMTAFLEAIKFAGSQESIPVITIKVSGLAPNRLLEKVQNRINLTASEDLKWIRVKSRLDQVCRSAKELGVRIFVDAEESWIQGSIDHLVESLMERYNEESVVVYHTLQMYRKGRLQYLQTLYEFSQIKRYVLGVKIVRGAYLEKESDRAKDQGHDSPIHETKSLVDRDYNLALKFCIERYKEIALCTATHNQESCELQARIISEFDLPRNHPHLNFCQLYGMGDHLTFNLAAAGYNVAKYLVYGKLHEVVPYLARRADENTATKGELGREYKLLLEEQERRSRKSS